MNKTELVSKFTRTFYKLGFEIKKHSPEILVVAGVVGTVASAVMACKATTKVSAIIDNAKSGVEAVHYGLEHPEELSDNYTVEDSKKDLAIIYAQAGAQLIKLYAPAVALGALSITAILTSNNILRQRNLALAAAYTAVDKSFKGYRNRVVERFGEELDKELRYNIKAVEVKETVEDENGKKKTVKKTIQVADPNVYSEFARCYDDGCLGWEKNSEFNLKFIRMQESHANDILQKRGYLFLNEVYDMFGIPKTTAGHVVGWIYDPENPDHEGDNFVNFGIYDLNKPANRDFVNGYERVIWLDFNVDGDIIHKVKKWDF